MDPTLSFKESLVKTFEPRRQKKARRSLTGIQIGSAGVLLAGTALAVPAAIPAAASGIGRMVMKRPLLSLGAAGLLSTKPGRQLAGQAGRTVFRGGAKIPEGIAKAQETGKIGDILKAGGLLGAGIGALVAGEKIIEKIKERRIEKQMAVPAASPQIQVLPAQPDIQPIGEMKPEEKPAEKVAGPAAMPDIINKISVKPEINVKVSQNRKFINQQVSLLSTL